MADQIKAEVRESFGKGAARKLRAAGKIPAVLYGHGSEPQHVSLPGHEVSLILRRSNAVLELDIAGTTQLALVKDVQKDPVRQIIEHLDLVLIRSGERVQVEIAVHVEGEPQAGLTVAQDAATLTIEAEATHIPERLTVSVEGLGEGTHITAAEVTLPQGSVLVSAPETLVIAIGASQEQDLGESAEAAPEPAADADTAADNG
ncbi:50S ribosomal protein L25/general stress protein Ctc [Naasia aerilata]|uniref:Large ribosomal subunit protein bL25 n=1 Tax=Naasia aerilata TaxID=1162966 RepID=A0ABN6XLQ1_9MICO|nr:50S ribosomal protein L25/general stress protein Ctc [Naasia aerilata]BDZ44702.1 50S ribosomal protein L25 [Naasia aerilata]